MLACIWREAHNNSVKTKTLPAFDEPVKILRIPRSSQGVTTYARHAIASNLKKTVDFSVTADEGKSVKVSILYQYRSPVPAIVRRRLVSNRA